MRRALVTGGSSPLGSAICQQLAAEGMHVIVHSHVAIDRAAALVDSIRQSGFSAEMLQFDVTDVAAAEATLAQVLEAGVPQVLVHNAGTPR